MKEKKMVIKHVTADFLLFLLLLFPTPSKSPPPSSSSSSSLPMQVLRCSTLKGSAASSDTW